MEWFIIHKNTHTICLAKQDQLGSYKWVTVQWCQIIYPGDCIRL